MTRRSFIRNLLALAVSAPTVAAVSGRFRAKFAYASKPVEHSKGIAVIPRYNLVNGEFIRMPDEPDLLAGVKINPAWVSAFREEIGDLL